MVGALSFAEGGCASAMGSRFGGDKACPRRHSALSVPSLNEWPQSPLAIIRRLKALGYAETADRVTYGSLDAFLLPLEQPISSEEWIEPGDKKIEALRVAFGAAPSPHGERGLKVEVKQVTMPMAFSVKTGLKPSEVPPGWHQVGQAQWERLSSLSLDPDLDPVEIQIGRDQVQMFSRLYACRYSPGVLVGLHTQLY